MTVRPSRPPPPSPPSSRRSRSSARPPSPASLPPAMLASVRLDSTTISPAGASDRPYPRARDPTRGANGDQLCAETPLRRLFIPCLQPGPRARARGAARARFSPRPARGFHLSLVGGSTWHSCCNFSRGAQTSPPPHRARISDSTFPSLFSLVIFSSPRTPSPTTSSRASPTSR